jgi:hypothetical protein
VFYKQEQEAVMGKSKRTDWTTRSGTLVREREPIKRHPFRRLEIEWLGNHEPELYEHHAGKWVGIDGTGWVVADRSIVQVLKLARRDGRENPFVVGIPAPEEPESFYG